MGKEWKRERKMRMRVWWRITPREYSREICSLVVRQDGVVIFDMQALIVPLILMQELSSPLIGEALVNQLSRTT